MNFGTHTNNENANVVASTGMTKNYLKDKLAKFTPTPGSLAEKFALRDAANRSNQAQPIASFTPCGDVDHPMTNVIEKVADVEEKKDEEEEEERIGDARKGGENRKKREKKEKREKEASSKKKRDVASLNTSETKDVQRPLRIKRRKDVRESIGISASVVKRDSIPARDVETGDDASDGKKDNLEMFVDTLRMCFDAINARLNRIQEENARAGSLILDAIEALGERVQENYDKMEDVDRKVFVVMEKCTEREERENAHNEQGVVASAKQAAHHAEVKEESQEKIFGINPEVYLGKTFRNCKTLSQFLVGFERRERVPDAIRPLLSSASLSCCTSYVHNYSKIVKHIRCVIRAFDSKFRDKSENYDDFLSRAYSAIEEVFTQSGSTIKKKKGATWHAAVKRYLATPDEDERELIEFEWNLRGAVKKAYETWSA